MRIEARDGNRLRFTGLQQWGTNIYAIPRFHLAFKVQTIGIQCKMKGSTKMRSSQKRQLTLAAFGLLGLAALVLPHVAVAQSPRFPNPPELSVLQLPAKTLGPAVSGGSPTLGTITFTSKNGPFCIQGFVVSASPSAPVAANQFGDVWINLQYIDGIGVSHPYITLADSATGGFSAYDIVLNYGGPICAAKTVQFGLIQWQAQMGSGTTIGLIGEAIISTANGNTVTVK